MCIRDRLDPNQSREMATREFRQELLEAQAKRTQLLNELRPLRLNPIVLFLRLIQYLLNAFNVKELLSLFDHFYRADILQFGA